MITVDGRSGTCGLAKPLLNIDCMADQVSGQRPTFLTCRSHSREWMYTDERERISGFM